MSKPTYIGFSEKFPNYPDFSGEPWFDVVKVSKSSSGEEWSSPCQIPARAERTHVQGDVYLFTTACAHYKVTFVDELPTHFRTLPEKYRNHRLYSALTNLTRSERSSYVVISGTDDEGNLVEVTVDLEFPEYFDGQFRTGLRKNQGCIILK